MQSLCQWNCITHGSDVLTISFQRGEGHCRVVARERVSYTVLEVHTLLRADFNNALYYYSSVKCPRGRI